VDRVRIERAIGTHKEVQMFDNDARKAGFSLRTGSMLARAGGRRVDGNTTFDPASIGKGK